LAVVEAEMNIKKARRKHYKRMYKDYLKCPVKHTCNGDLKWWPQVMTLTLIMDQRKKSMLFGFYTNPPKVRILDEKGVRPEDFDIESGG